MRVTDLRVDGFGVWTELHLADLSDRVTVFYGANEAGKTTLMQFMRTVLYGFSQDRRARYLPPVHGGQAGGLLQVENNRQLLDIQRHLTHCELADEQEQLSIHAADGASLAPAFLEQLLAGVDEPTFNNVFAVGLRELQELATLDDTDAAELLYKLTTGLDRVSLVDVMQELDGACRQLLDTEDPSSRIIELKARRTQLQTRVDELSETGHDWLVLETERIELADHAGTLEQHIDELSRTTQIVDAAIQTRDLWGKRAALNRQLELLEPAPDVSDSSLEQLEQLSKKLEDGQRQVELLKRRRREIRQEASLLPLNPKLWSQAARIEAMTELAPWIVSLQTQVDLLRGEVQALEARLAHSSTPLVSDHDEPVSSPLPEISRRTLAALRVPARAVRDESQRLKQAQEELEAARTQYDEMTIELETALLDQGHEDLATAVEQTGSEVALLRRHRHLDERVSEMVRQKTALQRDHHELLGEQVLSLKTLAWLGVPFVVGVMLVIGGVVWPSVPSLGWPVAILGLVGWGVGVAAKISMERSAARDLEQCERQLDLLTNQIKQAQDELDEVAAELPRNVGDLDKKMARSESDLATLEELLPLEASLQAIRQRAQATQRRFDQLTESVKDARARWRQALRRADLPETLSPQAVRQLADGNEDLLQTRRQLKLKREELASRSQELATLASRVTQIAEQVELQYAISDPQQLLNHLSVAVGEQRTLYERRKKLRHEDRQVQREGHRIIARLRESKTHRRAILVRTGVDSEAELRRVAALAQQRRLLEEEVEEVDQQMRLALGNRFEFELVERELIDHAKEQLEQRYTLLTEQIQQRQTELATVHQQQGAIDQQTKTLLDDRRAADAQLELSCVEQQLIDAVQRWRVLAVTANLLETVRVIYETHRQPQTLIDASRFFEQLTEGQYVRMWTPLTDTSLMVDMATGESLSLDVLSCGTREAVFLSLRLALVADFARRGVMLPLVLDDVLVNFDLQRARAAANVLCEFAEHGHQVLMFTCHEHIVELFRSRQVAIRNLPNHANLDQMPLQNETPMPVDAEIEDDVVVVDDELELECEEVEYEEGELDTEDASYALEEEEDILEPHNYEYLLEQHEIPVAKEEEEEEEEEDVEQYEEWDEEDEEPDLAVTATEEEEFAEEEEQEEVANDGRQQRFTWESPERWWDGSASGGAAA